MWLVLFCVCTDVAVLGNCVPPQSNGAEQQAASPVERPREWDCTTGERVIWRIETGGFNGFPAVVGGKILLGSNRARPRNPQIKGKHGAMSCFSTGKGELLWQATHVPLPERHQDMPAALFRQPSVEGNRLWYVSNRGELVCLDLAGFHDGKNDGPFKEEEHSGPKDADLIWKLDMVAKLGIYKRDAGDVCSPMPGTLVAGDLVYCITGNGIGAGLDSVPRPDAPSFLAVNRRTGKVVWSSNLPGKDIIYGQWSSPVLARVDGRPQIIFPGGDGRLYGFEPATGRLLWKFDCNPPGATLRRPGKRGTPPRDFFVGVPTVHAEMLYVGLSQEPEMGPDARRPLWAIDLRRVADSSEKAVLWKFTDKAFGGTYGTPAVSGDVLYTVAATGVLFALDLKTGRELWRSDLDGGGANSLCSPRVHAGKVLVGTEAGGLFVFEADRRKKCLGRYEMGETVQGAPAVDGDIVYVSTRYALWALRLAGK